MDKIVIKHEGNVIADFREAAKVGNAEVQEFINYVYMFYGPSGVYDMGVTKEDIAKATAVRLLSFPKIEFAGDSLDREKVRMILEEEGFEELADASI